MRELTVTRQLATPVNFIVHSLMDVNDQLARGRPFFADIARDGIALYEAPGHPLALPRQLDAQEIRAEAKAHYDKWFPDAAYCLQLAEYAIRDGQAGSRIISACATGEPSHPTVLVDRGFMADTISARPPVDPANRTPVEVTGVLRLPDRPSLFTVRNDPAAGRWFSRDAAAMAAALKAPAPAAAAFLMAETATNPELRSLVPAPIPAEISNRHLEYALTWFGLAAALVGVYAALLLSRRKS